MCTVSVSMCVCTEYVKMYSKMKLYLQSNADKHIINGNKNKYACSSIMFSLVLLAILLVWTLPILQLSVVRIRFPLSSSSSSFALSLLLASANVLSGRNAITTTTTTTELQANNSRTKRNLVRSLSVFLLLVHYSVFTHWTTNSYDSITGSQSI